MDFGELLHKAQKNEKSKDERPRYYSTKFEPPKKEKKGTTKLSENIKKFLAKKEEEERKKAEELRKKRDELLALRSQDKKATKRVNVMLKRTKSANQSVIQDAVDNDNTAVTLAGPMQPDEDDYGYVSQEASQFYNKMMEKYNKMPDEPKFDMNKKKVSTNLGSTKDRVRAALEREKEEAMLPHKRKRKHKDKEEDEDGVSFGTPDRTTDERDRKGDESYEKSDKERMPPPKPKPKMAAPPPINFAELIKIAEKKQFEPIKIEKKEKEDERLLTKKQRREIERERESQMRREERRRHMLSNGRIPNVGAKNTEKEKTSERPTPKISKTSDNAKSINNNDSAKLENDKSSSKSGSSGKEKPSSSKSSSKVAATKVKEDISEEKYIPGKYLPGDMRYRPELENKKPSPSDLISKKRPEPIQKLPSKSSSIDNISKKPLPNNSQYSQHKKVSPTEARVRESQESQYTNKPHTSKSSNVPQKKPSLEPQAKKFPPEDVRRKSPAKLPAKQFPPPDIKRRDERLGLVRSKKTIPVKRGRILDDDDSEYDSEMDDFIDDGDAGEDYSKYISEIFGYDKSRYRGLDDDVDNMESTFAQQMKEEVISTKLGIMEDLEEERKEEEAKRKKMIMKKKMRS